MSTAALRPAPKRQYVRRDSLRRAIVELARENHPVSVRQLYYMLVAGNIIEKDEDEYAVVGRLSLEMRKKGEMPISWVVDNGRKLHGYYTAKNVAEALDDTVSQYRRDFWGTQSRGLIVAGEAEALYNVFESTCRRYQVPLFLNKGFPSYSLAQIVGERCDRFPAGVTILYYGDWDPAGVCIPDKLSEFLLGGTEDCPRPLTRRPVTIERRAINHRQIGEWGLLTHPVTKRDTRSIIWRNEGRGEACELEALPPKQLRKMLEEDLEAWVPKLAWEEHRAIENEEKSGLEKFINKYRDDTP